MSESGDDSEGAGGFDWEEYTAKRGILVQQNYVDVKLASKARREREQKKEERAGEEEGADEEHRAGEGNRAGEVDRAGEEDRAGEVDRQAGS